MAPLRLKAQNVVASLDLEGKIDLVALSQSQIEARYDPDQFPGVVVHLPDPRVTLLFFSSGKVTIVGVKRLQDIGKAARAARAAVDREHRDDQPARVVNIVVSGNLGIEVDATRFLQAVGHEGFEYNFENPRSLIYRDRESKHVIFISRRGKFTLVGGRSPEGIREVARRFLSKYFGELRASRTSNPDNVTIDEVEVTV